VKKYTHVTNYQPKFAALLWTLGWKLRLTSDTFSST